MNRILTNKIKSFMLSSGMDLVGFGPVERWKNAPFLLSPKAILPECETVIVAAIHITDTWTEMGGEPTAQDSSPGGWMSQNDFMDRISFKTARLIRKNGYKAIPVVSSNIWRYRLSEDIGTLFAPDLSLMHAAVAAGLGELGWSGLAITPEFGPRVRFMAVVTDAVLEPTPMYDGPKLCDMCGECIKCCPSYALKKDFNSEKPHVVEIGGKTYKYANKNIWRCAWAEHFNLDLDSDTLKEEHIDESVILKELNTKGRRGHERGVCQKVCIPPHLRTSEPSFGRENKLIGMNRINHRYPKAMPTLKKMRDDLIAKAVDFGAQIVGVSHINQDSPVARLLSVRAPGMKTVLGFAFRIPKEAAILPNSNSYISKPYRYAISEKRHNCAIRLAKEIEACGYHSAAFAGPFEFYVPTNLVSLMPSEYDLSKHNDPIDLIAYELCQMAGVGQIGDMFTTNEFGEYVAVGAVVTDAELDSLPCGEGEPEKIIHQTKGIKELIKNIADRNSVDLFGVADATDFNTTVLDLKNKFQDEQLGRYVIDNNKLSPSHGQYIPKIVSEDIRIMTPAEYMLDASSVIVLGMGFPDEVVENAGLPGTREIVPYTFYSFQVIYELYFAALEIAVALNENGYKTLIHSNILGIGSKTDSPRHPMPDFRCGAIEAYAAGLGEIGKHGGLLTPDFGANQRLITIITDAKIEPDKAYDGEKLCTDCGNCKSKCPMNAVCNGSFPIRVGKNIIYYPNIYRNRCDWAKRYSLHFGEGTELLGITTNVEPKSGGEVSIEEIAEACIHKDPLTKVRTAILEPCLRNCRSLGK